MNTFTVTLTDAELKALAYVALDPQEWIDNAVHNRCRQAIDQIYAEEVQRMTDDHSIDSIPANKEQVVLDAQVQSATDRQAAAESEMP